MIDEKNLLDPTLIILKNSTEKDIVPSPKELEIGEIALSLYPGQEALWVKNSDGEIKNIRKPKPEALWSDCFSVYANRTIFDHDLEDGLISKDRLCFIVAEKQIWAQGEFYGSDFEPEGLDQLIEQRLISIPLDVIFLNPKTDSSKSIEEAWGGVDNFKTVAIAIYNNKVLATIDTSAARISSIRVSIPVSVYSEIRNPEEILVAIDGVYEGAVYHIETLYKNKLFGIQNYKQADVVDIKEKLDNVDQRLRTVEDNQCWVEA